MNFTPLASSSAGNAYLVSSPGVAPLLIECGIPIKRLREKLYAHNVSLSDLAGCLVSHEHMDHAKAVKDLLKMGLDCYMSMGTAKALGVEKHHRVNMFQNTRDGAYRVIDVAAQWVALPFVLEHDSEEPAGFLITPYGYEERDERLLFIPDTSHVVNRFKNVTIVAIECNHIADILSHNIQSGNLPPVVGHRVRRNHMSLDSVIAMLKANDLSRCRHIYLLHLSDANSDEALMIRRVQEATGIPCSAAGEM